MAAIAKEIPKPQNKQNTTEALLDAVKAIPRIIYDEKACDMVPLYIFNTEIALEKFPDPKSQEIILKLASKKILVKRIPYDRNWGSWTELRETLLSEYRNKWSIIDELEEELGENTMRCYADLTTAYENKRQATQELIYAKCEENNWKDVPSVIDKVEKMGLISFIEALPTDLSVYTMLKRPNTIHEAYEIAKTRQERMKCLENVVIQELTNRVQMLEGQVTQLNLKINELNVQMENQKLPEPPVAMPKVIVRKRKRKTKEVKTKLPSVNFTEPRLCHSLGIETDMNDSRKFLFLMWDNAPADMIKHSCLPEGTKVTKQQDFISWNGKKIESIGKFLIGLDFGEFRVKRHIFVISDDTEDVLEDDGVLRQNFGKIVKKNEELFFTYETAEGVVELQFGVDCPKKGNCGHYFAKKGPAQTNSEPSPTSPMMIGNGATPTKSPEMS